jgi:regulator of sirC expression with transglutaminase-like and TPR domain
MREMEPPTAFPTACRPEAFQYVRQQLHRLDSTHGLVHCILGVSLHALDDACPQAIDCELDRLADQVREQCSSANSARRNRTSLITYLHEVLFEQEGFGGSPQERYYNPLNSYLPAVFTLKHGLPITLGVVYKAVAERVGLPVEGIFSRGHFLVRVQDQQGWLIVDPYHRGRILTVAEACQLISGIVGEPLQPDSRHLPTASHKQWLQRVIVNLMHVFEAMRLEHDLQAMQELLTLVEEHG